VVATDVVQAPNHKQQVEPMLEKSGAFPEGPWAMSNISCRMQAISALAT
jgi:hypothetical protein